MDFLTQFQAKMAAAGLAPVVIDTFGRYYRQLQSGEKGLIANCDIAPVTPDDVTDYNALAPLAAEGAQYFSQTVMIRLNGGLGTSMGLQGPKSLLPVKNGRTFLDIIHAQTTFQKAQLCLMNSFSTEKATIEALSGKIPQPTLFLQHQFPKVLQQTLTPASWSDNPNQEWNPPGHGDVFTALLTSGCLDELLNSNIQYAFIANIDNLGATVDPALLGYFVRQKSPFMMEVAEKTPGDKKGGHLAKLPNGRFVLREVAQCPAYELDAFTDIQVYRYFNTNNIWINLRALKHIFDTEGSLPLPMIVNPKTLDPRDDTSPPVFQIESAMGAAISLFDGAEAVRVPRTRFIPVKKCSDLLVLRSDCYQLKEDQSLARTPTVKTALPQVNLDDRFYKKVDAFESRFPAGAPSLRQCQSLEINGDVRFGKDVTLKGNVRILNNTSKQVEIASGSILEGITQFD